MVMHLDYGDAVRFQRRVCLCLENEPLPRAVFLGLQPAIVDGLGLNAHFRRVYGGNSFDYKKPHPVGVEALMAECGTTRDRTLMVGDSAVDVQTARNAQITACGVTWGFQPETFAEHPPDFLIERPGELAERILHRD